MQHHADHRPARPLAAVHAAPRRRRDPTVRLERQPHPVVTARDVVLCNQLLPEVPGGEMPVPGIEQIQQCHPPRRPRRGARKPDPGGGRKDPPRPRPQSDRASVGTCARTCPGSRLPPAGSTHPCRCVRKPHRTSSISTPVTALSGASAPPLSGGVLMPDRSFVTLTGHITCYRHSSTECLT